MSIDERPFAMHPQTWKRLYRAVRCAGIEIPQITETLAGRWHGERPNQSDGQFENDYGQSEPYSSSFCCSIRHPVPLHGVNLLNFAVSLTHHGIAVFVPHTDATRPLQFLLAIDTNLPLHMNAVEFVMTFIRMLEQDRPLAVCTAWLIDIPQIERNHLAARLRDNLCQFSHVTL